MYLYFADNEGDNRMLLKNSVGKSNILIGLNTWERVSVSQINETLSDDN